MSLNMNQSALSGGDDFSTRALRGEIDPHFGAVDHDRFEDRAGLSTHVETSDRGGRRHQGRGEQQRIDEESNETGRSSPAGTIGEQHEYMSENIESNVLNKKDIKQKYKGYGNHSSISIKEQAISNIARAGQNIQND